MASPANPSHDGRRAHFPSTVPLVVGHEDLIHDVCYDFYGHRLVTCSSDQRLKVFDLNEDEEWKENDSWKAHDANIARVTWAHPEFGQIIASCSFDRTVKIFEEQETEPKNSGRRWKQVFRIIGDTRGAIYDICFAPAHLGLKLAYISSDGVVQIQEAIEPHNTARWTSVDEFRVFSSAPPREAETSFCLTYCPSRWGGEQLLVGAMDRVRIYRHNSQGKFRPAEELPGHKGLVRDVSWAPSLGRNYHLIATACKDTYVRIFKLTDPGSTFSPRSSRPASRSKDRPSGMGGSFNGPMGPPGHEMQRTGSMLSPPSMSGLSAEAGSGGGGGFNHHHHHHSQEDDDAAEAQEAKELQGFKVETIAAFPDHEREVWRVEWNATGTVLSSAGDDGKVRLWKSSKSRQFQCMSILRTSDNPETRLKSAAA